MAEFVLPDFLKETEEETHKRMIEMAPPNIDTSEGSLYWDNTRPTAMEKARLVEFELTFTLMMKFPQFAVGVFLDWHGEPIGVYRRPAVKATGKVTFEGKENTPIPAGTIVTTIGDENEPGYLYEVVEDGLINESGSVTLKIQAVEAGAVGNVPAGTIRGIIKPIQGLTNIINHEPTSGGTDKEDDDSYRERILDHHRNKPLSGAKSDYVKWAKEVPGVGDVIVIPLWNGPKTVKVLITDSNRNFASPELIQAVKNHIDPVDGMGEGRAPIGAVVTVDTITAITVDISFDRLELMDGFLLADVLQNIKETLNESFADKDVIKLSEVGAVVINTPGVSDYNGLLLNESTDNIIIAEGERAVVGEVTVNG